MAKKENSRGALLTIWLILMLISTILTAASYLIIMAFLALGAPNGSATESLGFTAAVINPIIQSVPSWAVYFLGIFSVLNLIFIILLFKWKKWAFLGLCITAIIVLIVNLAIGTGALLSFLGLLGPIILYLLLRPKWNLLQ